MARILLPRRRGRSSLGALLMIAVLGSVVVLWIFWKLAANMMTAAQNQGLPGGRPETAPFQRAWSTDTFGSATYEMAPVPGKPGEFLALDRDRIYRYDSTGTQRDKFNAPSKSSRLASDPSGTM